MAKRKGRASGGAKKKPARQHPLLKLFVFLLLVTVGGGWGLLTIGEKYADNIPYYQQARAWAYTLRDRVLNVPDRTITVGSLDEAAKSPYDNLSAGVPALTSTVVDRRGYALGYSESVEQPLWVSYKLTADEVLNKRVRRGDDFRLDPYIPTGSAVLEDYAKSNYDRGHLAPAADMAWSEKAMSESFYLSNMSPQRPEFNRGVWKQLEEKVRDWAVENGEIYVVTGPVFGDRSRSVGRNKVVIPEGYYKVIYAPSAQPPKMIGFFLPNQGSNRRLYEFAVTVDAVQSLTRLSFFSNVKPELRKQLESTFDVEAWSWK